MIGLGAIPLLQLLQAVSLVGAGDPLGLGVNYSQPRHVCRSDWTKRDEVALKGRLVDEEITEDLAARMPGWF